MVQADENDAGSGPGQYLVPGEVLLRSSSSVGIKKFFFNAYITDRRIFLVDQNEKKPGIISKDIPRDVVMGSHLESPGTPDPFLVLTIRTSEDETRTMKIAFVQAGNDRTAEIEEWISLLHGRPLRSVKQDPWRHDQQCRATVGTRRRYLPLFPKGLFGSRRTPAPQNRRRHVSGARREVRPRLPARLPLRH